jgi:hypothetical protein
MVKKMNSVKSFFKVIGLALLNVLTMLFGKPEDVEYMRNYTQQAAVAA